MTIGNRLLSSRRRAADDAGGREEPGAALLGAARPGERPAGAAQHDADAARVRADGQGAGAHEGGRLCLGARQDDVMDMV